MAFQLHTANKLEKLATAFVEQVYQRRRTDWLAPETVVVQTRGLATWLRGFVAGHTPIAANLTMPFLAAAVTAQMEKFYPGEFARSAANFTPDALAWRIFARLSAAPERYGELREYLDGDGGELKRWQLARRTADLFDQYILYRFDDVEKLLAAGEPWQKRLYDEITAGMTPPDGYFKDFLRRPNVPAAALPKRISIFGVGAMVPLYLWFFARLGRFTEVNFFYLNCCCEHWSYQYSRREARQFLEPDEPPAPGNPLLSAFGTLGRGFYNRIFDLPEEEFIQSGESFEDYVPAGSDAPDTYRDATLLTALQQDIYRMFDRAPGGDGVTVGHPRPDLGGDGTVAIHNCHSRRREVEVLHDELLRLFDTESDLEPRDVIVMTPDINAYGDIINAVFSAGPLADSFAVADRSVRENGTVLDTFFRIFSIVSGRFEAPELLALLDVPPLRNAIGIAEDEIAAIADAIQAAGICWGFDAAAHARFARVPFAQYTWRQGLDRLLLGYARAEPEVPHGADSILGVDAIGADNLECFGRFIAFVEKLGALHRELVGSRPATEWVRIFYRVAADFFQNDAATLAELSALRAALAAVEQHQTDDAPAIGLETVLAMVESQLTPPESGNGFLRGKMTFCSMVPMRSVPAQVVAILGLNEGEFPRRDLKLGFNLLNRRRRCGDRSHQAEDRWLFLEALLAARRRLLLFYQGESAKNSDRYPPAVPLAELRDYLERGFGFHEMIHVLQPFDPAVFSGAHPSYSRENFQAALQLAAPPDARPEEPPTAARDAVITLPEPPEATAEEATMPTLEELIRFFENPARSFLRTRLALRLEEFAQTVPPAAEAMQPDALAEFNLHGAMLKWELAGMPEHVQYQVLSRSSMLPVGILGSVSFAALRSTLATLDDAWRLRLRTGVRLPIAFETLRGTIFGAPDGSEQWVCRCARFKHAIAVRAMLGHLARNAQTDLPPAATRLLTLESGVFTARFLPPFAADAARQRLARLLEFFAAGQTRPLAILPRTSAAYARTHDFDAAEKVYAENRDGCDRSQPGVAECFTAECLSDAAFRAEFAECATLLYDGWEEVEDA